MYNGDKRAKTGVCVLLVHVQIRSALAITQRAAQQQKSTKRGACRSVTVRTCARHATLHRFQNAPIKFKRTHCVIKSKNQRKCEFERTIVNSNLKFAKTSEKSRKTTCENERTALISKRYCTLTTARNAHRSEEHTSELQSHHDL